MRKIYRVSIGAFISISLVLFAWGCGCEKSKSQGPPAPTNLTAVPGDSIVTLNWQASEGTTGYNIYMGSPDCTSLTKVASTTGTSYKVIGLTNGIQYCFIVRAFNADGESADSNQATATPTVPPPPSPPQPPTALTAISGNNIVTLRWEASSGATGYKIYIGSPDCSTFISTTTTTGANYQVTGLNNGTSYCFVVRAYNIGGESGPSNQATATPSALAPSPPTLSGIYPSITSITFTWTSVPSATGYLVYMGTSTVVLPICQDIFSSSEV